MKEKRGQAEVIVTVLLILISLAAVAVVSVFVIGLVRENLGGTDCFKTVGQFEIKSGEDGVTCVSADKKVSITIERGAKGEFNLTALAINVGDKQNSKVFTISEGLLAAGEKKTYEINASGETALTAINYVKVVPVVGKAKSCSEGAAEKEILACAAAA